MKLFIEERSEEDAASHDYRNAIKYRLESDGVLIELDFMDGEPEDSNLHRDFGDIYNIPSLVRAAYEAGKRGETLETEKSDYTFD